ncbi:MAG TPA: cyanophycinase [Chloroflexia bacterium]
MSLPLAPAAPLLLIGGGSASQPVDMLHEFAKLAGGPGARIAVITSGSRAPQQVGARYERFFRSIDMEVGVYHLLSRAESNDPAVLQGFADAQAYFFTGGEQLCITARMGGTEALRVLRRRHAEGAVLGGTSAGTSVMSETMIAFGNEGPVPSHSMVNLAPGLGFLHGIILDQHFSQRQRLGRLKTAVSYNPEELGVGVDEDTAALFRPDGTLEVLGPGTVTVVDELDVTDNTSPDVEDPDLPLCIEGVRIYQLSAGERFDCLGRSLAAIRAAA